MSPMELETFVTEWAKEAARHSVAGNTLRLQQNENYFRRVLLAHVPEQPAREALALLRRATFQRYVEEAA